MTVPDQISATDQARLMGEAKFLRALYYFQLVKMFGDVPLTTSEISSESDIPNTRTPVDKVFAQIIEDLQFAKANCTSKLLGGQATQAALDAVNRVRARARLNKTDLTILPDYKLPITKAAPH